jgi:arylformamidase
MRYIELSYPIGPYTTVLDPNIQPPRVISRSRMAEGGRNNSSYIEMFAHTGTHLDMPWHFNPNGKQILDFPVDSFIFSPVAWLEIPKQPWESILKADLVPHEEQIARVEALLIYTGFSAIRSTNPDVFIRGIPGFDLEAAQYLSGFDSLRCIGLDMISVENLERNRPLNYPVHHALLDRKAPIFLLEDANLSVVAGQTISRLFALPLRIAGLEASPVTAVAEVLID